MAQLSEIDYLYAIQQLRSHLQELIEEEYVQQVDRDLAKLLKQLSEETREDQLFKIISDHPKALNWWSNFFDETLKPPRGEPHFVRLVMKPSQPSHVGDGGLYGTPNVKPLPLITCSECGYSNDLKDRISWNDEIPCQNPDTGRWPPHTIKL